jgi:hypothetical protein
LSNLAIPNSSSAVVASEPAKYYTAETALRAVASVLVEQGCPDRIRLDRDPGNQTYYVQKKLHGHYVIV